ncbi:hypothetical protein DL96DRAFT_1621633 [Flagelloscypha sp. PMI_526]|nr:hypothetical protein DL96DRAFT_1621633 [Flagelloscypha sp. PMI_526]
MTMVNSIPSPRLPPELERPIFNFAARFSSETLSALLLVSRRVYEWLYPLRYLALEFGAGTSPKFTSLLTQKGSTFLATHVSSILIGNMPANGHREIAHGILARCLSVVDVALSNHEIRQPFPNLTAFPRLFMLSLDHPSSTAFNRFLREHEDVRFPMLTHLDANLDVFPAPETMELQFPSLSHFMISGSRKVALNISTILGLPHIRLVVIKDIDHGRISFPDDVRLVRITLDVSRILGQVKRDWKARRTCEMDLWGQAEEILRSRTKCCDIDPFEK